MIFPRGGPAAARAPHSSRSTDVAGQRVPGCVPEQLRAEWEALTQARPNALLAGTPQAIDEALAALTPQLEQPVRIFSPETGAALPKPLEGTLLLMEVAGLDGEQQQQLVRWLDDFDRRAHVQVVSTTSTRLFGLVESGDFLADLYYRLNVVRLDVATTHEPQ